MRCRAQEKYSLPGKKPTLILDQNRVSKKHMFVNYSFCRNWNVFRSVFSMGRLCGLTFLSTWHWTGVEDSPVEVRLENPKPWDKTIPCTAFYYHVKESCQGNVDTTDMCALVAILITETEEFHLHKNRICYKSQSSTSFIMVNLKWSNHIMQNQYHS